MNAEGNLSDQLRSAIEASTKSRYAICKACKIDQGTLTRFMQSRVGLSLRTVDRLARFLKLKLVKR